MPTYLKITFPETQTFIWNQTLNNEKLNGKEKEKALKKISVGDLKAISKELLLEDVIFGSFSLKTPRYILNVNHTHIENSNTFSATIEGDTLRVKGALLAKVSLKDEALKELNGFLKQVHISEFSIWNPESHSKKNFYKFTKTGDWKNDNSIELDIFSGKENSERKILIEVSSSKIKMK